MPIVFSEDLFKGNIFFEKCVLNLSIEIKKYDNGKEYYYLSYLWNYDNNDIKNHVLFENKKFIENSNDGDIILKNKLTDQLINFLIMNNQDLEQISGNSMPLDYKRSIIEAISLFWD